MNQKIFSVGIAFFFLIAVRGWAQTPEATTPAPIPAATRAEIECSAFFSATPVAKDIHVFEGADNDFRSPFHMFSTGNLVFLKSRAKERIAPGTEYRLVRPAAESVWGSAFYTEPRRIRMFAGSTWYPLQSWSMRALGTAYEDVGRVKVTTATPEGAVAEVTFVCSPVEFNDIAIPYQPREIPSYVPSTRFDRFPTPEGKLTGAITAANQNAGALGTGSIAYVNLGQTDGAQPGQKYRIFHINRDFTLEGWFKPLPDTPTESIGELVILTTQEKSSVAVVVSSTREISLGDGIVLE